MMAGRGEARLWGWGINERGRRHFKYSLKCSYDGRSKFPKALKEEFLGKQIRQSLKVGGQRSRDREEKGSVRKKKNC